MGTLYGIKDPNDNPQTNEMVTDYINKTELDKDFNFRPKKEDDYKGVSEYFENSYPEALIFDKNGKQLLYKINAEDCNAGLFRVIPTLTKDTKLESGQLTLDELLSKLDKMDNNEKSLETSDYDYLLAINWAVFMGKKLNKDHVLEWEKLAKNNTNCKIQIIKVNMDLKKEWQ
ncbi:MAG: sterile alpha motif-like domain-containing protein [Flavobacteriaceae bacterium]|jgi:uncharacterized protein YozE (UPF0346 family)|nr:sterile alpha motif-like domain-containing protein [Flavobacteriaceae bacterium]